MTGSNDPQQTELASKFTVADYQAAYALKNRAKIAEALRRRFRERYINPVTPEKGKEVHGFTMMAISCLMIESLQSFSEGWENSNGKSEIAFCHFFDSHSQFDSFRGYLAQFYRNVRCGILHQAETTGGWKIRRGNAPLFDPASLTINAEHFLQGLKDVLDGFCDSLKTSPWDSDDWQKVRRKMKAICENCKP